MPAVFDKQTLLLNSLSNFYQKPKHMDELLKCIHHSQVSLRLLDFLCTKYAKAKKVVYVPKTGQSINLYTSYKDQLKAYSKLRFDPFRRHDRIQFSNGKQKLETTIAQLNFFKWAIEIKLYDWILQNLPKIEKAMKAEVSEKKSRKRAD